MRKDIAGAGAMEFPRDGAQRIWRAISEGLLRTIAQVAARLTPRKAGVRLHGIPEIRSLLESSGPVWSVAAAVLGSDCRPVRAVLFDKTAETNWALGWHQDRAIAVAERIEVDGFGPWTIKDGLHHVVPPFELLAGMITLRVHLDPVSETNAPLLIAPGSHKIGRISESEIPLVVRRCGTYACLADAGDIWLYSAPILHASQAALEPEHRRVLQVDYAVGLLPGGLRWLGV